MRAQEEERKERDTFSQDDTRGNRRAAARPRATGSAQRRAGSEPTVERERGARRHPRIGNVSDAGGDRGVVVRARDLGGDVGGQDDDLIEVKRDVDAAGHTRRHRGAAATATAAVRGACRRQRGGGLVVVGGAVECGERLGIKANLVQGCRGRSRVVITRWQHHAEASVVASQSPRELRRCADR